MEELFKYFNIISKHTNVYLDQALAEFGLCSCHRPFVKIIVNNPGITRDKIKNMVHIHPSNTTRIIDFLEENDFIVKKINEEDRRLCELYPTVKLEKVYDCLCVVEKEWIDIITKGIDQEELVKYQEFLKVSATNSIENIHAKK